jgi:hypothetical protein
VRTLKLVEALQPLDCAHNSVAIVRRGDSDVLEDVWAEVGQHQKVVHAAAFERRSVVVHAQTRQPFIDSCTRMRQQNTSKRIVSFLSCLNVVRECM